MPFFESHLNQAKSNLDFLSKVDAIDDYWDWKVTIAFYVAVHIVNAHIAKVRQSTFRSHDEVSTALNPYNTSPTKVDERTYYAYDKLKMISRRSRYLISEKSTDHSQKTYSTYSKHYKKSLVHLNTVMEYFNGKYEWPFDVTSITCADLKAGELKHFN